MRLYSVFIPALCSCVCFIVLSLCLCSLRLPVIIKVLSYLVLSYGSMGVYLGYCVQFFVFVLLWSPYGIGQTIIYFHAVVCSFFFFFFSSPNLDRRRLDVCHTSTHGVALVRI